MIYISEPEPCLAQAVGDGLGGETRLLDTPKALLFGRRDKDTIADERRRGIAVECIESENDHDACGGERKVICASGSPQSGRTRPYMTKCLRYEHGTLYH